MKISLRYRTSVFKLSHKDAACSGSEPKTLFFPLNLTHLALCHRILENWNQYRKT